jgi:nicotinamidase-related amidase
MNKAIKVDLVIIDPQNDFCDIIARPGDPVGLTLPDGTQFRSTLPVPGALADMGRVASLVKRVGKRIHDIHVTLAGQNQDAGAAAARRDRGA